MSGAGAALFAVVLAGGAVALSVPAHSRTRLRAVREGSSRPAVAAGSAEAADRAPRASLMLLASVTGGAGVAVLVGGPAGVVLGCCVVPAAMVVLPRLEPRAVRRRRERLAADLPTAVDLLGACLVAGRPPTDALRAVAAAVGGPLAAELGAVTVRLELGADPVAVWRGLGRHAGPLAPLGRAMARSLETGAPVAESLRLLADDLRGRRRDALEQQARSVGVRAAAPLGLCFLPAFVLVGIVPAIAAAFASMSWW